MLLRMRKASDAFYQQAVGIRCHPFIEFAGLMNEYIKLCEWTHADGVDFASCNGHSGQQLPMPDFSKAYIDEKLECIFTGRVVMESTE